MKRANKVMKHMTGDKQTKRKIAVLNEVTAVGDIPAIVQRLRTYYLSRATRNIEWRRRQLKALHKLCSENQEEIQEALTKDLRKPLLETTVAETLGMIKEVENAINNLNSWTAPERVSTPLFQVKGMSTCEIHSQPLGTVLIVGAFNYPFHLVVSPLVGALAAGCTAVCKPSELTVHTSQLIGRLFSKYLDADAVAVVQGGVEVSKALLEEKWDKIFFTGSERVGKIVAQAAAKHLTPVTLELGGKCPVYVDKSADIRQSAYRIMSTKFVNAGQTCVAPDYILVHESVHDVFVQQCTQAVQDFYGKDPQQSKDLARIVNPASTQRLKGLIESSKANVVVGGAQFVDVDDCYVPPTVLTRVPLDSPIMQEEIFGPILPILKIKSPSDAIEFMNNRPHPLAMYVFSSDTSVTRHISDNTTSGGICINECMYHLTVRDLPFGGVGASGMGNYHGKFSFDCFSHKRACLDKTRWGEPLALRTPPYNDFQLGLIKSIYP